MCNVHHRVSIYFSCKYKTQVPVSTGYLSCASSIVVEITAINQKVWSTCGDASITAQVTSDLGRRVLNGTSGYTACWLFNAGFWSIYSNLRTVPELRKKQFTALCLSNLLPYRTLSKLFFYRLNLGVLLTQRCKWQTKYPKTRPALEE